MTPQEKDELSETIKQGIQDSRFTYYHSGMGESFAVVFCVLLAISTVITLFFDGNYRMFFGILLPLTMVLSMLVNKWLAFALGLLAIGWGSYCALTA